MTSTLLCGCLTKARSLSGGTRTTRARGRPTCRCFTTWLITGKVNFCRRQAFTITCISIISRARQESTITFLWTTPFQILLSSMQSSLTPGTAYKTLITMPNGSYFSQIISIILHGRRNWPSKQSCVPISALAPHKSRKSPTIGTVFSAHSLILLTTICPALPSTKTLLVLVTGSGQLVRSPKISMAQDTTRWFCFHLLDTIIS